jgi:hypothetical protein
LDIGIQFATDDGRLSGLVIGDSGQSIHAKSNMSGVVVGSSCDLVSESTTPQPPIPSKPSSSSTGPPSEIVLSPNPSTSSTRSFQPNDYPFSSLTPTTAATTAPSSLSSKDSSNSLLSNTTESFDNESPTALNLCRSCFVGGFSCQREAEQTLDALHNWIAHTTFTTSTRILPLPSLPLSSSNTSSTGTKSSNLWDIDYHDSVKSNLDWCRDIKLSLATQKDLEYGLALSAVLLQNNHHHQQSLAQRERQQQQEDQERRRQLLDKMAQNVSLFFRLFWVLLVLWGAIGNWRGPI